jgi:citrate synthase
MIADPEYKIGRPRQLFVGSTKRDVKPIEKREAQQPMPQR